MANTLWSTDCLRHPNVERFHVKKNESEHLVKPGGKNAQHEQELPPSRDYEQQRAGGIKKEGGSGAKAKDPRKS
jgi:hypothetical protein